MSDFESDFLSDFLDIGNPFAPDFGDTTSDDFALPLESSRQLPAFGSFSDSLSLMHNEHRTSFDDFTVTHEGQHQDHNRSSLTEHYNIPGATPLLFQSASLDLDGNHLPSGHHKVASNVVTPHNLLVPTTTSPSVAPFTPKSSKKRLQVPPISNTTPSTSQSTPPVLLFMRGARKRDYHDINSMTELHSKPFKWRAAVLISNAILGRLKAQDIMFRLICVNDTTSQVPSIVDDGITMENAANTKNIKLRDSSTQGYKEVEFKIVFTTFGHDFNKSKFKVEVLRNDSGSPVIMMTSNAFDIFARRNRKPYDRKSRKRSKESGEPKNKKRKVKK